MKISSKSPKAKQFGLSCCGSPIQSPQEKDRLTGYLIKVTLPVELAPAPLAWCLGVRSPSLERLRFQHLIFCQVFYPHVTVGMAYAKRPPSNLYMLPMLCLSGSKPFTPSNEAITYVSDSDISCSLRFTAGPNFPALCLFRAGSRPALLLRAGNPASPYKNLCLRSQLAGFTTFYRYYIAGLYVEYSLLARYKRDIKPSRGVVEGYAFLPLEIGA